MSDAAQDATVIQEIIQGIIVQNYITYATLTVLVYDASKPSLIRAN